MLSVSFQGQMAAVFHGSEPSYLRLSHIPSKCMLEDIRWRQQHCSSYNDMGHFKLRRRGDLQCCSRRPGICHADPPHHKDYHRVVVSGLGLLLLDPESGQP